MYFKNLSKTLSALALLAISSNSALCDIERTFAIIKPDAMIAGHAAKIKQRITDHGLKIVNEKIICMSDDQANQLYAEHVCKPFFKDLVKYMRSGRITVMVLEGDNAIQNYRNLMGSTDPLAAKKGTLRKDFGTDKGHNAVHGSDSFQSAQREIGIFFPNLK